MKTGATGRLSASARDGGRSWILTTGKEIVKHMNNCGNCKYCSYDWELSEYVCHNEDSDAYGLETDYNESCGEWEER